MNPLRKAIVDAGFEIEAAMNTLTNARLISDLCVTPEDVAEPDLTKATRHILKLSEENNKRRK